jgi:hypothetical protein
MRRRPRTISEVGPCTPNATTDRPRQVRRREVVVNGKRVTTVDIHAHCAIRNWQSMNTKPAIALAVFVESLGGWSLCGSPQPIRSDRCSTDTSLHRMGKLGLRRPNPAEYSLANQAGLPKERRNATAAKVGSNSSRGSHLHSHRAGEIGATWEWLCSSARCSNQANVICRANEKYRCALRCGDSAMGQSRRGRDVRFQGIADRSRGSSDVACQHRTQGRRAWPAPSLQVG